MSITNTKQEAMGIKPNLSKEMEFLVPQKDQAEVVPDDCNSAFRAAGRHLLARMLEEGRRVN
jgi:hypothetical protein